MTKEQCNEECLGIDWCATFKFGKSSSCSVYEKGCKRSEAPDVAMFEKFGRNPSKVVATCTHFKS